MPSCLPTSSLLNEVIPVTLPARPIEAGDYALLNRIGPKSEDDWNRIGGCLRCTHREAAAERNDHAHLTPHQIGGQSRQAIWVVIGPTNINR